MHDHHGTHDHHDHQSMTMEEAAALLRYNADHNAHHAEELHDIAHYLGDASQPEAAEKLHAACHLIEDASALIREALALCGGK